MLTERPAGAQPVRPDAALLSPARDRFHWRVLSHLGSNFYR